jgi:hypothetical protein
MRHPEQAQEPARLLDLIEAVVGGDRGPVMRTGRLSFGIAAPTSRSWLHVDLEAAGARAHRGAYAGAQAGLIVGQREAEALLSLGDLPADPVTFVVGDATLLKYFFERFFGTKSLWGAFGSRNTSPERRPRISNKVRRRP